MNRQNINGLFVLDKPRGLTSRDAVNRVQTWFPRGTKVGHTGTLDPLATGVLVICLGSATRLADYVQQMKKTYRTTVRLGATSDTDDADGTATPVADAIPPIRDALELALAKLTGPIDQVPPAYSAIKVEGQRSYDLARAGVDANLKPRRVEVYRIDILSFDYPFLQLEIECSKGTYIRSLARDLGHALGCGGMVQELRRLAVGPFSVEQAVTLDSSFEVVMQHLRPLRDALAELPAVTVSDTQAERLRFGQTLRIAGAVAGEAAVVDSRGRLIAIGVVDATAMLKPIKVLPPE
jgi:tRNA pseudouridine55 synthase